MLVLVGVAFKSEISKPVKMDKLSAVVLIQATSSQTGCETQRTTVNPDGDFLCCFYGAVLCGDVASTAVICVGFQILQSRIPNVQSLLCGEKRRQICHQNMPSLSFYFLALKVKTVWSQKKKAFQAKD